MPFKMIIWSGSIIQKGRNDSWIRKVFRKWLIHQSNASVVYGSKAGEYLISLGIHPSRIFTAINTVDTRFFSEETLKQRKSISMSPPYRFCTVGYFSKRKNGSAILKVIKKLSESHSDFVLDVIGEGNDMATMKLFVQENGLQKHVIFHGYRQQNELPEFLAASTAFLFQTDFDIWGLVLNEAMAAGLCCLSSKNAGATHDLIVHGRNGYAVDFEDTETTASLLGLLLQNRELAESMGREAALTIQQKATIEISAEGFINGIKKSMET